MSDTEHAQAYLKTGRWGRKAVGVLFLAPTGRIGLTLRSAEVLEPGTYGIVGGAVDSNENEQLAAIREVYEELGVKIASNHLDHLHRHTEPQFEYVTFLYSTQSEFTPYWLNWESDTFVWFGPDELPTNLHPGLAAMLEDPDVRAKLRLHTRFLAGSPRRGGPVVPSTKPVTGARVKHGGD